MLSFIITLLPLLAKLGGYFITKYIAKDAASVAKAKILVDQWVNTCHVIAAGLTESVEIGDRQAAAKARLDARFNELKGKL